MFVFSFVLYFVCEALLDIGAVSSVLSMLGGLHLHLHLFVSIGNTNACSNLHYDFSIDVMAR